MLADSLDVSHCIGCDLLFCKPSTSFRAVALAVFQGSQPRILALQLEWDIPKPDRAPDVNLAAEGPRITHSRSNHRAGQAGSLSSLAISPRHMYQDSMCLDVCR